MKNMEYKVKQYYKKIVLLCIILLCLSINVIINNIQIYHDIQNPQMLNNVLDTQNFSIIFFYKSECSVCKKYKKVINKVIINTGCTIYGFDIENNNFDKMEILEQFNLSEVPTTIVFRQKKEVSRYVGYVEYATIIKKIKKIKK